MESSVGQFVVVMGVSGCGKSSVGKLMAEKLDAVFYDGDDLHPPVNIKKMSDGIPLTDDDRWPWLEIINELAGRECQAGRTIVVACSALKASYRQRLSAGAIPAWFVYLQGSKELIARRQSSREGHFMPAALLESQFATLEDPSGEPCVICVDIDQSLAQIVDTSVRSIKGAERA